MHINASLNGYIDCDSISLCPQAVLQARIREYKLAALRSKQEGDIEMATKYYRLAKVGVLYLLDSLSIQ